MSNAYASVLRRIWAREIRKDTLAVPADIEFTAGNFSDAANPYVFMFPQEWINLNSIISVHSVGIFSNFADGLVYKSPGQSVQLKIAAVGFVDEVLLSGLISMNAGDKIITGDVDTLFQTELGIGNFIKVTDTNPSPDETYVFRVTSVPADDSMYVNNYSHTTFAALPATKLQSVSGSAGASRTLDIKELNVMHPLEFYLAPTSVASAPYTSIALVVSVRSFTGVNFLTKSIDASYNGDDAFFDVAVDFEITPYTGAFIG